MAAQAPAGLPLILTPHPYKAYARIAQLFHPDKFPPARRARSARLGRGVKLGRGCIVEEGAVIEDGAEIGAGCWIGPLAVIGRNVVLGPSCRIGAQATVSHALLGANVRLYPGVRVGQDGLVSLSTPPAMSRCRSLAGSSSKTMSRSAPHDHRPRLRPGHGQRRRHLDRQFGADRP